MTTALLKIFDDITDVGDNHNEIAIWDDIVIWDDMGHNHNEIVVED